MLTLKYQDYDGKAQEIHGIVSAYLNWDDDDLGHFLNADLAQGGYYKFGPLDPAKAETLFVVLYDEDGELGRSYLLRAADAAVWLASGKVPNNVLSTLISK